MYDEGIARCVECGRLYEYTPGRRICSECAGLLAQEEAKRPPAPARKRERNKPRPGASRPRPQPGQLAGPKPGASEAEREFYRLRAIPRCTRCNLRPQNGNAQFCLICQTELNANLGEASAELFPPMEPLTERRQLIGDVLTAYEEKRARTPTSHINLVGGVPLKWWVRR